MPRHFFAPGGSGGGSGGGGLGGSAPGGLGGPGGGIPGGARPAVPAVSAAPAPPSAPPALPPAAAPPTDWPSPTAAATSLPAELKEEIQFLEKWTQDNLKDAASDRWKFWVLKGAAIALSTAGAIAAALKREAAAAILGALTAGVVAVDGLVKPGRLRGAHLRAVHELRELERDLDTEWKAGILEKKDPHDKLTARLLRRAKEGRTKIDEALQHAETERWE